jgi:amidohydrolase
VRTLAIAGLVSLSLTTAATAQTVPSFVNSEIPALVDTYKDIHAHPELSHFEARTSGILAAAMRDAGYTVTERVGHYPDGSQAYGVVGILKHGPGPTLMIRADMDALPIVEETGVPYASHVTMKDRAGQTVGVMHACGHDVHTTVMIGTARAMVAMKSQWHGTLMLVGQPSEETIDGAKAMLADHLYERFGRPDRIIGLHDTNGLAAGTVGVRSGASAASSTSIDVVIRGIGGHGPRIPTAAATPSPSPRFTSRKFRPSSAAKKIRRTPPSSPSATSKAAPSATSSPTRSSWS